GAPIERTALHAITVAEHDIAGKVAALAAKPISDPGAGAGKARPPDPGVDLIKRRHMIVRFGIKRFDEAEIVDVFGDVGIFFADPRAGLAVLLKIEGRLHQRARIAIEDIYVDPFSIAF